MTYCQKSFRNRFTNIPEHDGKGKVTILATAGFLISAINPPLGDLHFTILGNTITVNDSLKLLSKFIRPMKSWRLLPRM